AGLEVPLQAHVELGGLVGIESLVAAGPVPALLAGATGQAAVCDVFGAVVLQAAGGGDVGVARARHHLRRCAAQHQGVGEVVGQVEAGQHVGVGTVQRAHLERLGSRHAVRESPVAFAPA